MPLSDVKIRTLKPREKPFKVSDERGLLMLVTPKGSKLWRFKYRFQSKEKSLAIGIYPDVSLAQARLARDAARALVAMGRDPSAEKRANKDEEAAHRENSFKTQALAFFSEAEKVGKADATLAKVEWLLGMAITDFGNMPIKNVDSPTVLRCLRKIEAKGNYETAKRLRAVIGAVFRYAVANGVADTDPTYALRDALIRPTVTHRSAITDANALGGLLRAIDAFDGQITTRIGLQLLAILAQRPGELRHATWSEFDMGAAIWTIPAECMKMRRPHKVPLPAQALTQLDELRLLTGNGVYLFPSLRSVQRPMSENTMNGALRRMGYSGDEMTAHGFRASFSTIANESGLWNPDAIERALAHVEGNAVRRAYARGEHWDERVKMSNWWAGFLEDVKAS